MACRLFSTKPSYQPMLSIGTLGTNFSEIYMIEIQTFHPQKCNWKCRRGHFVLGEASELTWIQKSMHCLFVFVFYCHQVDMNYAVRVKHWLVKAKLAYMTHRLWHWNVKEFILFFQHIIFVLYIVWKFLFFMSRSLPIGWISVILEKCYQMMSPRWYHQSGHLNISELWHILKIIKGVGAALLYHDPCRNQHCKITVFA